MKAYFFRLQVIILILALLFAFLPAPALAADGVLRAADQDTGTDTASDSGTWEQVTTSGAYVAGLGLVNGDKVLVIASFESTQAKDLGVSYKIENGDASAVSTIFQRELTATKTADYGIGTIVHILTAQGDSNDIFKLWHMPDSNNPVTTIGTIVAIPLETTANATLSYGEKYRTAADNVAAAGAWEEVGDTGSGGDCKTGSVTLGVVSHIYVAASIECEQGGGAAQTGEWKLQYSTDNFATVKNDLDYSAFRYTNSNADMGLVSLVGCCWRRRRA